MDTHATILIVVNDPLLQTTAQQVLEQASYETLSAPDGETALRLAQEHQPDLMLLEMNLPGIDGFEVCRCIKANPVLASLYVLMISGARIDVDSKVEGLEIGADEYLVGPFSNRELLARVRALLRMRAAERAATEQAVRWQATFNAVSDAILLTDSDSTILQCNRAAAEIFQLAPNEIVGHKFFRVIQDGEDAVSTGSEPPVRDPQRRETLTFTRAGRWLEVRVDPMLDTNGRFIGAVHVISDVTERKQAEENLHRSTHEAEILQQAAAYLTSSLDLKQVLDSLLIQLAQVVSYDSATVFLLQNDRLLAVAGQGLPFPESVIGQQFPTSNELFIEMRNTGRPQIISDVQIDARFQKWGGADYVRGWMAIPLMVGGEIIGRLTVDSRKVNAYGETHVKLALAFANQAAIAIQNARLYEQAQREITERKQAEETLRKNEEKLRAILDATPFPIAIVDLEDNNIEFWSRSAMVLFGHTASTTPEWYRIAYPDPDYRRDVIDRWKPFLVKARQSAHAVNTGEYRVTCHDGSVRICELYAAFLSDHLIVTFNDITEPKQTEQKLDEERILLRTLIDNLPDLIYVMDEQGRKIISNIADWQASGGKSMEDIIGKTDFDTYPPELAVEYWAIDKKVIDSGLSFINIEEPGLDSQGNPVRLLTSKVPLRDNQGKIIGLVGIGHDITELKQAESLQNAIYRIAQTAEQAESLESLYSSIHAIIQEVMVADNFYIALYDEKNDLLSFPYSIDEVDPPFTVQKPGRGLSEYVLRTGKSLLCDETVFEELRQRGEVKLVGANSLIWLGVPLMIAGKVIGVMAVQDYKNIQAYSEREQRILEFVSSQVAMTIHHKQAEQALRESEERYRRLVETLPDGVIVHSQGRIVFANPASAKISGAASPAELIGKSVFEFVHPDYRESALNRIQQSISAGVATSFAEEKFIRLDGTPIDVGVIGTPFTYVGKPAMLTVFNDITERKQAEDKLHENEQRLASIYDTVGDVIFYLTVEPDEQYRFSSVNSAFARVTGLPFEQVIGKKVNEVIPEPSLSMVLGMYRRAIEEKTMVRWEEITDYPTGRLTGEVSIAPVFNEAGSSTHLVGSVHDISERKRAEAILQEYSTRLENEVEARTRELRDTQEQLVRQEKLAILGQLAGGVGHELRNPLAVIQNAVYFLKLFQPEADEKVRQYHGIIEQEAHTAEKIITDLLDFARIKSVDREPSAVGELVSQTLERYPAPPSVEVALELPAYLPPVYVDPHHVLQVLGNLVVNAYQAMPAGGKLTFSAHRQDEMIAIAVTDTGIGIPPENMKKLFEPLFTTKAKGIGLGLAVSQKLAAANGGRIEAQSKPDTGSIFTLFLPEYRKPA